MRPQWLPLRIVGLGLCFIVLILSGCAPDEPAASPTPDPASTATGSGAAAPQATTGALATPTPTPTAAAAPLPTATVIPAVSACAGLSGNLEISVQVGPAEVAGLDPIAVGQIPFSTSGTAAPFTVSGRDTIDYSDTLEKEWGTYTVNMNMQATILGDCGGASGMEQLNLAVEMAGDQLVVVTAEGFQNQYPWHGTHTFALEFPVSNGATSEGEGWAFTLLLSPQ